MRSRRTSLAVELAHREPERGGDGLGLDGAEVLLAVLDLAELGLVERHPRIELRRLGREVRLGQPQQLSPVLHAFPGSERHMEMSCILSNPSQECCEQCNASTR